MYLMIVLYLKNKQTATTTTTKLVNNEFVKSSFRIKMECVNKRHNADILYLNSSCMRTSNRQAIF